MSALLPLWNAVAALKSQLRDGLSGEIDGQM
jgi:hypothetical protein